MERDEPDEPDIDEVYRRIAEAILRANRALRDATELVDAVVESRESHFAFGHRSNDSLSHPELHSRQLPDRRFEDR